MTQSARRIWHEMVTPREIGYSGAGTVLAFGDDVEGFQVGQTVAYAATGHAELAAPAINHVVPVPDDVDLRHAAFVTVGGIAIQALRRAELQFGEVVAIYGLGLVGQLAARIALAAGCVVVGIDVNPRANELAREAGASFVVDPSDPEWKRQILDFTGKHGVDATIVCASSDSSEIINSSMEITRRQGRVVHRRLRQARHPPEALPLPRDRPAVLAGVRAGQLPHRLREGPARLPVRLRALDREAEPRRAHPPALDRARSHLEPLIGGVYDLEDVQSAFDAVQQRTLGGLAALIRYRDEEPDRAADARDPPPAAQATARSASRSSGSATTCSRSTSRTCGRCAGSRSAASRRRPAATPPRSPRRSTPRSSRPTSRRCSTIPAPTACSSPPIQPEHYEHLCQAIEADKAILVEKPMVTRLDHFRDILRRMEGDGHPPHRRPQPPLLADDQAAPRRGRRRRSTRSSYTVTRPFLPPDHWSLDPIDGGGRLISEGEHFVDLCNLLIGQTPISVYARALGTGRPTTSARSATTP